MTPHELSRRWLLALVLLAPSLTAESELFDEAAELLDYDDVESLNLLSTEVKIKHILEHEDMGAMVQTSVLESKRETTEHVTTTPRSFYHYSLIPLLLLTGVAAWFTRPQLDSPDEMTPAFREHRFKFLSVWAVAASADWLQGPYVFALYDSFGYSKSDIDKLFVVGFAASMVFGTVAGSIADSWGRKRTTLLYCALYIISCMTKHCSLYGVLIFGRITGGMATSLLFSSFECWMVSENNERHQFSTALLRYMFSLMFFVNYLVAIFSGLVAQTFVDAIPMRKFSPNSSLHYGGNICPFDLAILMLCMAFPTICYTWSENYGDAENKQTFMMSMGAAYKAITSSWRISIIGVVVACFEGAMYAFVINWTPTLGLPGAPPPPHGLIFSAMMMCCMIGSSIFSFFNPSINPAKVLVLACFTASLSFALVAYNCGSVAAVSTIYFGFLCFEACVGIYMPAIGALKSELVPEEARAGVYNWYRVPLNLVVCSVILTDLSLRSAFLVCAGLLAVSTVAIFPFTMEKMPSKLVKAREA